MSAESGRDRREIDYLSFVPEAISHSTTRSGESGKKELLHSDRWPSEKKKSCAPGSTPSKSTPSSIPTIRKLSIPIFLKWAVHQLVSYDLSMMESINVT